MNEASISYFNSRIYEKYDTLVLSGGSVKGIITLGALQCLFDMKKTDYSDIVNFVAVSVGTMISVLIAIGYTPEEIFVKLCSYNLKGLEIDVSKALKGEGALDFEIILNFIEELILDKIGYLPSLQDVKEHFGKNLLFVTYNDTTQEEVLLMADTHPCLCCLTAIRMSSSVPELFSYFEYNGSYYVDGGITNNFPLDIAEKINEHQEVRGTNTPPSPPPTILGICTIPSKEIRDPSKNNIIERTYKHMYVIIEKNMNRVVESLSPYTRANILKVSEPTNFDLNRDGSNFFKIKQTTTTRVAFFEHGYKAMSKLLTFQQSP